MYDLAVAEKRKKPRDLNALARRIVDESTGETPPGKGKDPNAVALGRKGGLKGGKARAAKLSSARRREIAVTAAKARWAAHEREG